MEHVKTRRGAPTGFTVLSCDEATELIVGDIDPGLESDLGVKNTKKKNEAEQKPSVKFEYDEKPIVPFETEDKKPIVPFDLEEKPKIKVEDTTPDGQPILWNLLKDMDIVKKDERTDDDDDGVEIENQGEDEVEKPLIDLTLEQDTDTANKGDVTVKLENETKDKVFSKSTNQSQKIKIDPDDSSNYDLFEKELANIMSENGSPIGCSVLSDSGDTFGSDFTLSNKKNDELTPSTSNKAHLTGGTSSSLLHQADLNERTSVSISDYKETCENAESHPTNTSKTTNDNNDRQTSEVDQSFSKTRNILSHENRECDKGPECSKTTVSIENCTETDQRHSSDDSHDGNDQQPAENVTVFCKNATADNKRKPVTTAQDPQASTSKDKGNPTKNATTAANPPLKCTHEHVLKLECLYCGNMYSTRGSILKHIAIHHGELSKQTVCDVCGKKFKTRVAMIQHRSRQHSSEEYTCVTCSAKFKRKEVLRDHITKQHLPQAPKKCRYCAKAFDDGKTLKLHLDAVHGGEKKKLLCSVCGKGFSASNLEQHMLIHTDEKPHSCEECGKCFRTESNLYQHSRTHSDLRPFKCDVCEKAFRIKHHLKQHMATHGMASVPKYGRRGKKSC